MHLPDFVLDWLDVALFRMAGWIRYLFDFCVAMVAFIFMLAVSMGVGPKKQK